ncbi:hypothetical protein [Kitasatospora cheerisanensis]|uniref:Uncharacterized protein n=1 Tax=Kitasatospora cheerisanensis KCTC 2395 TaxID=1348663 RepID=A0A066Z2E3_9ACTN|nr:hypothetical protein [Kitasatospora cheerisanensis]KDN87948.1 hypothetical protein KCH_02750 [Kitasatospora cheerisanensis KCTC 2395]
MARGWTRVTGWAAVLSSVFAAGHGTAVALLPSGQAAGTAERVLPGAVAVLCALGWLAAAALDRRRAPLRKDTGAGRPSWLLAGLIGIGMVLASVAALAQANGPDQADGRQLRRIAQAGGVERQLPIVAVRSESEELGRVNRRRVLRTTVDLQVPYAAGPRTVTTQVETNGRPHAGDLVTARFAPTAPELGVRAEREMTVDGLGLIWILGLGAVCLVFTPIVTIDSRARIHAWRRYRPDVHLPSLALLALGAAAAAYVGLALPSPWLGWPLAGLAAATPWLCLTLAGRASSEERERPAAG